MRSPMIIIGVVLAAVLVAVGIGWILPPIQRSVVHRSVAWQAPGASFRVLKIISQKVNDKPAVALFCRWDAPDGVSRFVLSFPEEANVIYPDQKKYSPGVSPMGPRDFVIHLPLPDYPRPLSSLKVTIACIDKESGSRNLGQQTVCVRYWPSRESGIPVDSIK